MSLEELTCDELVCLCQKHGLSKSYRSKAELVERLHEYFGEPAVETPEEDFFVFMRAKWREAKEKGERKADYFREAAMTWKDDDNMPVGFLPYCVSK